MKKTFIYILGIFLTVFLAGCVEIKEDVWINADGSGRLRIDIGVVSEEVPTFGGETMEAAIKSYREDMVKDMKIREQNIAKMEGIKNIRVSQSYASKKGELDHFIYDIHLSGIERINDVFQEIKRERIDEALNWNITIKRLENKDILFVQTFANEKTEKKTNEAETSPAQEKERFYNVRLHGPRIILTNGALDKRLRTAEWNISFKDLSDEHYYKKELTAEIKLLRKRYLLVFAIIAIIIITCAIGLVRSIKRS